MAATTDVIEALKYMYGATRVEMILNKKAIFWNDFKKMPVRIGGRGQFITPIYHQLPEGISGITEGGTLPSARQPDTSEATFSAQEYAAMVNVTWKLLSDAAGGDKMAFENALSLLDRGLRTSFVQTLSNDMLDDGRGRLAILPAGDNTSPVTVNRPIRARKNMIVDIMDTDNDAVHLDSGVISAVNYNNNTIAVSGSISSTGAGDYFVLEDTCDDSQNDSLHVNGVLGIVDDADPAGVVGDYGGIDRGTAGNEYWESVVLDNGGTNRALTEDLMLQAILEIRLKGGGETDRIYTNPNVLRRYFQLFAADRFIEGGDSAGMSGGLGLEGATKIGDGGKTSLSFSGIPIYIDDFFAANTMVGLDRSDWKIAHGKNRVPQPVSETFDRANFFRDTTSATFEIVSWWQGELICQNPASQWKIEDLAES